MITGPETMVFFPVMAAAALAPRRCTPEINKNRHGGKNLT
jgi:hypothetical protein